MLENVPNLSGCRKLQNISALGTAHTLNLFYCDSITDIRMLKNVAKLTKPPYF